MSFKMNGVVLLFVCRQHANSLLWRMRLPEQKSEQKLLRGECLQLLTPEASTECQSVPL